MGGVPVLHTGWPLVVSVGALDGNFGPAILVKFAHRLSASITQWSTENVLSWADINAMAHRGDAATGRIRPQVSVLILKPTLPLLPENLS